MKKALCVAATAILSLSMVHGQDCPSLEQIDATCTASANSDINRSGRVDVQDLLDLLASFDTDTTICGIGTDVVISEINYNPCSTQGQDTHHEFLEIYNRGSSSVDISGWTFDDGISFTFPDDTGLGAGEYAVIARSEANDDPEVERPNDWFADVPNFFCCFEFNGDSQTALSNSGETVRLVTTCGVEVVTVTYDDASPWPTAPDQNLCSSLEMIPANMGGDPNDAANWEASCTFADDGSLAHGTPGFANSDVDDGCPLAPPVCQAENTPAGSCHPSNGIVSGVMVGCEPSTEGSEFGAANSGVTCTTSELILDWVGGQHASGSASFGAGEIQAPDHADTEVVLSDPLNGCGPVCDGPSCPGAELPDATDKIMLIQRGTCYFTDKVLAAQNAGAKAVIIYNDGRADQSLVNPSPPDGFDLDSITISSIFISNADGTRLALAVDSAATTVSMHCGQQRTCSDNAGCGCNCKLGFGGADCSEEQAPPADVYISHIADPNSGAAARFVEIYNPSCDTIDLEASGYSMRRFTNAGPDFTTNTVYNFEGQTIASKGFLTLCKSMADFNVAYAADSPSPRTCDVDIGDSGPADSNGDDQISLWKGDDMIDIFGVPGEDGTGTDHEFEDGQTVRTTAGPTPTWDVAHWEVRSDASGAEGPDRVDAIYPVRDLVALGIDTVVC